MDDKLQGIFFKGRAEDNYIGHITAEIYKDKLYAPFLEGKQDLVICDIGANVGIVSFYFSQFAKQVYAVEPSAEHFDTLNRMIVFNELKNVKPIQKAIYIENKQLPFYHNKNKTMFSLHQAVEDNTQAPEMVEAITLDKLFEDEKIEHCDLLKLDVEGSEVEILSSEGFRIVAPKVDLVIGESHQWSQRHPNQLREAFKNNGFSFETIPSDANIFVAKRI